MSVYYNENDPYAAQWLRNLIAAGHIAPGEVDERNIRDVGADLATFVSIMRKTPKPDDGNIATHFENDIRWLSVSYRLTSTHVPRTFGLALREETNLRRWLARKHVRISGLAIYVDFLKERPNGRFVAQVLGLTSGHVMSQPNLGEFVIAENGDDKYWIRKSPISRGEIINSYLNLPIKPILREIQGFDHRELRSWVKRNCSEHNFANVGTFWCYGAE